MDLRMSSAAAAISHRRARDWGIDRKRWGKADYGSEIDASRSPIARTLSGMARMG
jgi:hypothetical protein